MKTTRRVMNVPPKRPKLDKLLEWARTYTMTPAEMKAQRHSWVRGEMMLEHPEMTREEVDAILKEIDP